MEDTKVNITEFPEMPKGKFILTHSGKFHCDESVSCAIMKYLYPDYAIVRINHINLSEEIMEKSEFTLDIGGKFDVKKKYFDHHQKGFEETFSKDFTTKLSSSGLAYKYYGKEVIAKRAKEKGIKLSDIILNNLYFKMYKKFIEHLDADDNGISVADEIRYEITTSLPWRIGSLNPKWNEKKEDINMNLLFHKAVSLASKEFFDFLDYFLLHWYPARSMVEKMFDNALLDGKVLEMIDYCPWKSHCFDIEKERNIEGKVLFCIFPASRNKNQYRVVCMPKEQGKFGNRLSFPKMWRGLRDDELSKIAGIKGCTFVHAAGFTGGNLTREGTLEMIKQTIKYAFKE